MDFLARIPFAPPPGFADSPQAVRDGQDHGGPPAVFAQLGTQTPPPPWGDLFVVVLQQHLGSVSAAVPAVAVQEGPAALPAASVERQMLSAGGKLLPPAPSQVMSGEWPVASRPLPAAVSGSREEGPEPPLQEIGSSLDLRLATRASRLSFDGPLVFMRSSDDSPPADRPVPPRAAPPPLPLSGAVNIQDDALTGAVGAVPAASPDTTTAAATSSSQATPSAIAVPPGSSGWNEAVGERVLWLIGNRISAAQLSLNPPDLGPLEVRIVLDGDKAQMHFASAHAPVREALEGALPRLKEMLAEAGIQLLDAGVRDAWSGGAHNAPAAAIEPVPSAEVDESPVSGGSASVRVAEGLLDLYA